MENYVEYPIQGITHKYCKKRGDSYEKNELKAFVAGMVITLVLLGVAIAEPMEQEIRVIYNNIKLFIDDSEYIPLDTNGKKVEPFVYNGTTYLPVRAIANAFDVNLYWDPKTNSIYLGKHGIDSPNIYLEDMDIFNHNLLNGGNFRTVLGAEGEKDNTGKRYTNGVIFKLEYSNDPWDVNVKEPSAEVEYLLNQKYNRFKGTFYLAYESRTCKDDCYLEISTDDKVIYTSEVMTGGQLPVDFDIDVEGAIKLKIKVYQIDIKGNGAVTNYLVLGNAGLYK